MSQTDDSKRRIACAPVLVLADDFFRGHLLRGDLEESGFPVQVLSTDGGADAGEGRLLPGVLLAHREGFRACRTAIFALLGIAESEDPGSTIPGS